MALKVLDYGQAAVAGHPAQAAPDTTDIDAMVQAISGQKGVYNGFDATTHGTWQVDIAAGSAQIPGSPVGAFTGGSIIINPNVSGYDRVDLICLQSDGASTTLNYVIGTVGNPGLPPPLPANNVLLYRVDIANQQTGITDPDLLDKRIILTSFLQSGVGGGQAKAAATGNVASLTGTTTLDTIACNAGDIVLLPAQTDATQNGLWQIGTPWTRPPVFPHGATVRNVQVFVAQGATNGSALFEMTNSTAVIVDTTAESWSKVNYVDTTSNQLVNGVKTFLQNILLGDGTVGIAQTASPGAGIIGIQKAFGTSYLYVPSSGGLICPGGDVIGFGAAAAAYLTDTVSGDTILRGQGGKTIRFGFNTPGTPSKMNLSESMLNVGVGGTFWSDLWVSHPTSHAVLHITNDGVNPHNAQINLEDNGVAKWVIFKASGDSKLHFFDAGVTFADQFTITPGSPSLAEFVGQLKVDNLLIASGGFQMPPGAVGGYFLQSDGTGRASWAPPPGGLGGAGATTGSITGDGATTVFTLTHNLGLVSPFLVLADFFLASGSDLQAKPAISALTANTTQVTFGVAPPSGQVINWIIGTGQTGPAGMTGSLPVVNVNTSSTLANLTSNMVAATTGPLTVTLPAATSGARVEVKKIDGSANYVTVVPAAGTIDGLPSYILGSQYQSVTLTSDGSNWWVL